MCFRWFFCLREEKKIFFFLLEGYVVDEIIILVVKMRVRVGNIDVEGCMVMVDFLYYMKLKVLLNDWLL